MKPGDQWVSKWDLCCLPSIELGAFWRLAPPFCATGNGKNEIRMFERWVQDVKEIRLSEFTYKLILCFEILKFWQQSPKSFDV